MSEDFFKTSAAVAPEFFNGTLARALQLVSLYPTVVSIQDASNEVAVVLSILSPIGYSANCYVGDYIVFLSRARDTSFECFDIQVWQEDKFLKYFQPNSGGQGTLAPATNTTLGGVIIPLGSSTPATKGYQIILYSTPPQITDTLGDLGFGTGVYNILVSINAPHENLYALNLPLGGQVGLTPASTLGDLFAFISANGQMDASLVGEGIQFTSQITGANSSIYFTTPDPVGLLETIPTFQGYGDPIQGTDAVSTAPGIQVDLLGNISLTPATTDAIGGVVVGSGLSSDNGKISTNSGLLYSSTYNNLLDENVTSLTENPKGSFEFIPWEVGRVLQYKAIISVDGFVIPEIIELSIQSKTVSVSIVAVSISFGGFYFVTGQMIIKDVVSNTVTFDTLAQVENQQYYILEQTIDDLITDFYVFRTEPTSGNDITVLSFCLDWLS